MGYSLGDDYVERVNCLEAVKKALILLRGEIKHNNSSICEALENIGVSNCHVMSFIRRVIKEYKYKQSSLWEAWKRGITDSFAKSSQLKKEEIKIIEDFGRNLGITDRETQMKNIDECIAEIDTLIGALKNEKKEKCKLYKVLGVLSGMFISIMLM
mgnify:CR=1 FL=1